MLKFGKANKNLNSRMMMCNDRYCTVTRQILLVYLVSFYRPGLPAVPRTLNRFHYCKDFAFKRIYPANKINFINLVGNF